LSSLRPGSGQALSEAKSVDVAPDDADPGCGQGGRGEEKLLLWDFFVDTVPTNPIEYVTFAGGVGASPSETYQAPPLSQESWPCRKSAPIRAANKIQLLRLEGLKRA
jgi:hypothetical protein